MRARWISLREQIQHHAERGEKRVLPHHHPIERMREEDAEAAAIGKPNVAQQSDNGAADVAEVKQKGDQRGQP